MGVNTKHVLLFGIEFLHPDHLNLGVALDQTPQIGGAQSSPNSPRASHVIAVEEGAQIQQQQEGGEPDGMEAVDEEEEGGNEERIENVVHGDQQERGSDESLPGGV